MPAAPSGTIPSSTPRTRPQAGQKAAQADARRPASPRAARLVLRQAEIDCAEGVDVDIGQRGQEPEEGDAECRAEQRAAAGHQPQTVDRVGDGIFGITPRGIGRLQWADHQAGGQAESSHAEERDGCGQDRAQSEGEMQTTSVGDRVLSSAYKRCRRRNPSRRRRSSPCPSSRSPWRAFRDARFRRSRRIVREKKARSCAPISPTTTNRNVTFPVRTAHDAQQHQQDFGDFAPDDDRPFAETVGQESGGRRQKRVGEEEADGSQGESQRRVDHFLAQRDREPAEHVVVDNAQKLRQQQTDETARSQTVVCASSLRWVA